MESPNEERLVPHFKTYFSEYMLPFPRLIEADVELKIDTNEFLEASRRVIIFTDILGKIFVPVRYDIKNNIEVIEQKYEENITKFAFIEDIIYFEKIIGEKTVAEAVLWLTRGLNFFSNILEKFIEDTSSVCSLSEIITEAYSETLEAHHGWLGTQLFNIMLKYCPNKFEFRNAVALQNYHAYEQVNKDISTYLRSLNVCVEHLIEFYSNTFEGLYNI